MKVCSKCGDPKELDEFNYSARHKFKVQSVCKVCQSNYSKEYIPANKEKYRENMATWRAAHPAAKDSEALRKAIIRLIKLGGAKPHEKLGYSGDQIRAALGITDYKKNSLAFKIPLSEFDLSADWDRAGAIENIILSPSRSKLQDFESNFQASHE